MEHPMEYDPDATYCSEWEALQMEEKRRTSIFDFQCEVTLNLRRSGRKRQNTQLYIAGLPHEYKTRLKTNLNTVQRSNKSNSSLIKTSNSQINHMQNCIKPALIKHEKIFNKRPVRKRNNFPKKQKELTQLYKEFNENIRLLFFETDALRPDRMINNLFKMKQLSNIDNGSTMASSSNIPSCEIPSKMDLLLQACDFLEKMKQESKNNPPERQSQVNTLTNFHSIELTKEFEENDPNIINQGFNPTEQTVNTTDDHNYCAAKRDSNKKTQRKIPLKINKNTKIMYYPSATYGVPENKKFENDFDNW